jgi:uncharacterized protein (TIGR03067 family)
MSLFHIGGLMRRILIILVVLPTPLLLAGDTDEAKKELKVLQGTWKVVALEAGGKAFPKEKVPDFTLVIAADGNATGKLPKGDLQYTMTVNPKKNPKTIDNLHTGGPQKGMKQYGIYKLEGDKWTVCMTRAGAEESERPKDFATSEKSTGVVFVFERVKEVKKTP